MYYYHYYHTSMRARPACTHIRADRFVSVKWFIHKGWYQCLLIWSLLSWILHLAYGSKHCYDVWNFILEQASPSDVKKLYNWWQIESVIYVNFWSQFPLWNNAIRINTQLSLNKVLKCCKTWFMSAGAQATMHGQQPLAGFEPTNQSQPFASWLTVAHAHAPSRSISVTEITYAVYPSIEGQIALVI